MNQQMYIDRNYMYQCIFDYTYIYMYMYKVSARTL